MVNKIFVITAMMVLMVSIGIIGTTSAIITNKGTIPLNTNESAFAISWSPDGTKIAYTSEPNSLRVMNADGTGKIQLVTFGGGSEEAFIFGYGIDWSPDSKNIAYMDYIKHNNTTIWKMDVETSHKMKLASNAAFPVWSPDGTKIAYAGYESDDPFDSDLWVMNTDGSEKRKLAAFGYIPIISWSPDGTKIAYTGGYTARHVDSPEIWVTNADGSGERKLASNAAFPVWSPDGTKIAYLSDELGDPHEYNNFIWVMDADGTEKTKLTTKSKSIYFLALSLSPDSTKIAYSLEDGSLWMVGIDEPGETLITSMYGFYSWSPDGKRIAYSSEQDDKKSIDLWVMTANETEKTKLASRSFFPKCSPDGTKIAYTHATYTSAHGDYDFGDIWVMTLGETESTFTTTPAPPGTPTVTPANEEESPSSEENGIPGFELVLAIAGLLAAVYILRRME